VTKEQASKAANLCFARGLYKEAIRDVYMKGNGLKIEVQLILLLEAAKNDQSLYDEIFAMLNNTEDTRTKDKFVGDDDDAKKLFINTKRSEITANDTIQLRIEDKLGIKVADVPKSGNAEPAQPEAQEAAETKTAPDQQPAETQPAAQPAEQPAPAGEQKPKEQSAGSDLGDAKDKLKKKQEELRKKTQQGQ
jgi:hypothetical protein